MVKQTYQKEIIMPIFDFKCTECGSVEEILLVKRKLSTFFPCPQCGKTNCMKKMVSAANIVERTNLRIPASKQRKRIL